MPDDPGGGVVIDENLSPEAIALAKRLQEKGVVGEGGKFKMKIDGEEELVDPDYLLVQGQKLKAADKFLAISKEGPKLSEEEEHARQFIKVTKASSESRNPEAFRQVMDLYGIGEDKQADMMARYNEEWDEKEGKSDVPKQTEGKGEISPAEVLKALRSMKPEDAPEWLRETARKAQDASEKDAAEAQEKDRQEIFGGTRKALKDHPELGKLTGGDAKKEKALEELAEYVVRTRVGIDYEDWGPKLYSDIATKIASLLTTLGIPLGPQKLPTAGAGRSGYSGDPTLYSREAPKRVKVTDPNHEKNAVRRMMALVNG